MICSVDGDRRNEFSVIRSMFRIQIEGCVLMANIVRESNPFAFQDRKEVIGSHSSIELSRLVNELATF